MSDTTNIQYSGTTVNPVDGCGGCELFPSPGQVLNAIDAALAETGAPAIAGTSRAVFKKLIREAHSQIAKPSKHHRKAVSTTNIWHLRKDFLRQVGARFGRDAAAAAELAIGKAITCYAAKLHLNRGYSLKPKRDGEPRKPHPGYAPTFEEVTRFDGRVLKAAKLPDLLGHDDLHKPWMSGLARIIFISDMGDAFSRKSDFPFLKREVIAPVKSEQGNRHLWLWLTKRPRRMAQFAEEIGGFPENVCAMTTLTGPDSLDRVDELRAVQAQVRGLSVEPLWEHISPEQLNLEGIDWLILGGESGARRTVRPFPVEWAEELRDYCRSQGVAFFLKQLGSNPTRDGEPIKLKDSHGGDWDEWDDGALQVREFPQYFHKYRSDE